MINSLKCANHLKVSKPFPLVLLVCLVVWLFVLALRVGVKSRRNVFDARYEHYSLPYCHSSEPERDRSFFVSRTVTCALSNGARSRQEAGRALAVREWHWSSWQVDNQHFLAQCAMILVLP